MRVVAKCVHAAKKAAKTGAFPVVTGRLDDRFVPSSQLTAPWTHELDIEKPRLQSFWMLWWSRAYVQLVIQSITNRQLLALGQLLDWRTNISCISMTDGAPVAMKLDELCWGQPVAQVEGRCHSLDTKSLYELNGSILAKAKQLVEKQAQKPPAAASKISKETQSPNSRTPGMAAAKEEGPGDRRTSNRRKATTDPRVGKEREKRRQTPEGRSEGAAGWRKCAAATPPGRSRTQPACIMTSLILACQMANHDPEPVRHLHAAVEKEWAFRQAPILDEEVEHLIQQIVHEPDRLMKKRAEALHYWTARAQQLDKERASMQESLPSHLQSTTGRLRPLAKRVTRGRRPPGPEPHRAPHPWIPSRW